MKKIFLITNPIKDPELRVTNSVAEYLRARGADVCMRGAGGSGAVRHTDPSWIPEDTECVIVLGGDGTLLRAAVDLVSRGIPLLGVNLGTLGYLAEIDRNMVFSAMDSLLEDRYSFEKRMLLRGDVLHDGEVTCSHVVLNDITVVREGSPRMISLKASVNGSFLSEYRADGLIVATPSGSTGYSLSAGGPIIAPQAEMFLLTPLADHTLNARSVVLPSDNIINIEVGDGKDGMVEHAQVSFDGETNISLVTGDRVEISKAAQSVTFVKIQDNSFLEILRKKMNR